MPGVPAAHHKHRILLGTPARRWKDGLPCGDGRTGAMLNGGVQTERILVNPESWYYKSSTPPLPDVSPLLPQVRELLDAGRVDEANHLYERELRARGFNPEIAVFQPGFDITLKRPDVYPFRNYRRWLDMESAEAHVEWQEDAVHHHRRMFVCRTEGVVVMEVSASAPGQVDLDVSIALHDFKDAVYQDGRRFEPGLTATSLAGEPFLFFAGAESATGRSFSGLARLVVHGGKARIDFEDSAARVRGADSLLIVAMGLPEGSGPEEVDLAREKLLSLPDNYERLLEPSRREHAGLFLRSTFSLGSGDVEVPNETLLQQAYAGEPPAALVERMWNYGRYLLICSSAPGGLPSHLQGIWNGDYDPPWQCFYMANENIQINYWQALPGNLPEVMEPLFSYYLGLMEDFRITAKRLFGCRGICIPAATAPDSGLPKLLHSHIIYWVSGAGWLARFFYDYYLFTGDENFLRERALPFMREVAWFYEDYLIPDDIGRVRFVPSISPENCPPERERAWSDGGPLFISENATMDVAICRELLSNLIEGARLAGLYPDELPKWSSLLSRLPEYQVNDDGAVREWLHPGYRDNYHHRHLSHLYPVFPGDEIVREANPELFQAFAVAVDKRLVVGLQDQTGWSLAHMANLHARMGDGDKALHCLELLARSCIGPNLFTYHNDYRRSGITMDMLWGETAPFQVDANMGWTAAIQEMVLHSRPGFLRILPALPSSWPRGRMDNMLARGGIRVNVEWDLTNRRIQLVLQSKLAQRVRLIFPEPVDVKSTVLDDFLKPARSGSGRELAIGLPGKESVHLELHLTLD